jgi:hypothetical protein
MSRILRTLWLALAVALVLVPARAWAGKRSMIPPGHEAEIRGLIERALGSEPRPGFAIERDRIRVSLGPAGPRFVILHPEGEVGDEPGTALAPGVIVSCGPAAGPRACSEAELAEQRPRAEALAREREPLAASLWTIEESGVAARPVEVAAAQPARDRLLDQAAFVLALLGGLLALGLEARGDRTARRIARGEGLALLGLLGAFVACTLHFTSPWPLHEHNSFVARADCAIDERCLEDPAAAWSPTSLHLQGLVLGGFGLGPRGPWLSWLSQVGVAVSLVVIVLAWALARRLLFALGVPAHARLAAFASAGLLALHPVHWRLAAAASFWPLALVGVLAAALAGLWASEREASGERLLGWSVAALALACACGGNVVLLTLAPLALLAPLCWTRQGFGRPALARAGAIALPSLALLGLVIASDVRYGLRRASESLGGEPLDPLRVVHDFNVLVLDPGITALPWLPLAACSLAWLSARTRAIAGLHASVHPLRLLAPLAWAWAVPHLYLCRAAGDLVGLGYPVGFINHHWELVLSSLGVALGTAWLLGVAAARRPAARQGVLASLVTATLALALVLAPLAREGWTMARGVLVVERELAALQTHLPALPEHDRLVVAPRVLEPLDGVERLGDAIEVVFPLHAYAEAMRAQGRTPAPVDDFAGLARAPLGPDERVLVYVGTSLRSFQPQEIAADRVPGSLERPPLAALREHYELAPALTFELAVDQHEAVTMRLAADRLPSVELGFYWLRPRATTRARG